MRRRRPPAPPAAAAALGAVLLAALAGAACQRSGGAVAGRVAVVSGVAPLAEAAERVAGPRARVVDLTPPGAEPHDLELGPRQVEAIEDAAVVVFVGGGFQPGVAKAARRSGRPVDVLGPDEGADPHIWLDPVRFRVAVGRIEEALARADPAGRPAYRRGADAFRAGLDQLDAAYRSGLAVCARRLFVTGHAAFGRLAARYGLEQEAITGISPEAEPDPRRLAEVTDLVRRRGVTTVFTEPLVSDRVAATVAREAGVTTAVLDPLESPAPGGYLTGMRRNLAALRAALGCH